MKQQTQYMLASRWLISMRNGIYGHYHKDQASVKWENRLEEFSPGTKVCHKKM